METVEKAKDVDVGGIIGAIQNLLGAGKIGWILLIVLGGMVIGFVIWWDKKQKKIAARKTKEGRVRDQASTVNENERIERDWERGEQDIDDIRKKYHGGKE